MYCIKYSTHPKTTHITHNLLTSKKKDICIHTIQIQMMMIFVRFYEKKEIKARRISRGFLYLLIICSLHQKKPKPIIHQFTAKRPESLLKPLFNGLSFLIYYFKIKKIFMYCFFILKALKDILQRFKFVNW